MQRRKFLQLLGMAPVALAAAKYLPAPKTWIGVDPAFGPDKTVIAVWQPSTAYRIGQKIKLSGFSNREHNGDFVVTATGTSGPIENSFGPLGDKKTFASGTMFLEKIYETRQQA